jgi:hypothetical protein
MTTGYGTVVSVSSTCVPNVGIDISMKHKSGSSLAEVLALDVLQRGEERCYHVARRLEGKGHLVPVRYPQERDLGVDLWQLGFHPAD